MKVRTCSAEQDTSQQQSVSQIEGVTSQGQRRGWLEGRRESRRVRVSIVSWQDLVSCLHS